MEILLIYPPDREIETEPGFPPLGLAHLAAFIQRAGHRPVIWDLNLNRWSDAEIMKNLLRLDSSPGMIGVGGIVTTFNHAVRIAGLCKKIFPEAPLVCGGSLGSTVSHHLFKHAPVDICIRGEGEQTLLELVTKLDQGATPEDLKGLPGTICRSHGDGEGVFTGPIRPHIKDLDVLGFPAYELIDMDRYTKYGMADLQLYRDDILFPKSINHRHVYLMTSRGCIGNCTFCYRQFSKIGLYSSTLVKEHIFYLNNTYGINIITFEDELFNISTKRLGEMAAIMREVKEKIPDFFFRINGLRVDRIDLDILKEFKEAGCFQVTYGLESGCQKILDLMRKKTTVVQNRAAVMMAKEAGLACVPQFVVGHPGETRETLNETLLFAESIDFWNSIAFHYANAYPGSEMYRYALEKNLIPDELEHIKKLGGTDKYLVPLGDISSIELKFRLLTFIIQRRIRQFYRNHDFVTASRILFHKIFKNLGNIIRNHG